MNETLEKKIQHDTAEVKNDLNALVEDGASKVTKGFEKIP